MIRPIDLQNTILQSSQSAAAVQRTEEGPRLSAQAAQAAFAAEVTQRDESVAATSEVTGSRIGAKPESRERRSNDKSTRTAFEEVVEDAAGLDDERHLIDFTA